jgi:deoxyuridine 5'-triphosphate nucleotidohydrolase
MRQGYDMTIKTTLAPGAIKPTYQTPGSAGMDLCSTEDVALQPLERSLVGTGVRMAIPKGFEGQVRPRSGLALKKGVSMVNTPGTIDSDYRGEIKCLLINLSQEPVLLAKGERIAQLVIVPVSQAYLEVVDDLDDTERGEGGFGSTG